MKEMTGAGMTLGRISYFTHVGGFDLSQGYGVAGFNIVKSLQEVGFETPFNDHSAPVGLNFTQPPEFQFHEGQHVIGYTPWESTELGHAWLRPMNKVDEMWTTSPLIAQWFEDAGVQPVKVFQHGIDHAWTPFEREPGDVLRFLHLGSPAPRKCGGMVVRAFLDAFEDDPRYKLTIKSNGPCDIRINPAAGFLMTPDQYSRNIDVVTENMTTEKLIMLHYQHHVLVYPSYGEGFGFIPLQAMATGMPVIMNTTWAPYSRYVPWELSIPDRLVDTKWPDMHPGRVLEPDYDSLVEAMIRIAGNYDRYRKKALDNSTLIHEEYDWTRLTREAFAPIIERFYS